MESPHMHSVLTAPEVRRVLSTAKGLTINKAVLKNLDPNGFSIFSIHVADASETRHRVRFTMKMLKKTIPVTGYADIPKTIWNTLPDLLAVEEGSPGKRKGNG